MSTDNTRTPRTIFDEEIVTTKKLSRRSMLAATGLGVAAGASAVVAGTKPAKAKDQKKADMRDRKPPKIDGSRDTD
jgi:hypothetical protein